MSKVRIEPVRRRGADDVVQAVTASAELGVTRHRASWDAVLGDFAATLDEVQRRLAAGAWEDAAEALADAGVGQPDAQPTPDQIETGAWLLERSRAVQAQLAQAMESTRAELSTFGRRREAAAGYLMQSGSDPA